MDGEISCRDRDGQEISMSNPGLTIEATRARAVLVPLRRPRCAAVGSMPASPAFEESLRVVAGMVAPTGPGLGTTWDERAVSRHAA